MKLPRLVALAVLTAIAIGVMSPLSASAATTNVSTFTQLQSAIATAAAGDVVVLDNDIVVASTVTIGTGITVDGAGFTLSVPTPGVTAAGLNATSPSTFRLFDVTSTSMVTLHDLTLLGGDMASGGAINIAPGARLTVSGTYIERSRNSVGGGGAVYNAGEFWMQNSFLRRNSAQFGGGVINAASALLVMNGSTLAENRTESANGGGGGVENQGTMWVVNSTIANNLTTAGGGAINNYHGQLFVAHSTFVGNVSTGPYDGGAILSFSGGAATIASSLFAYNYSKQASPAQFVLDDVGNSTASTPLAVASSITIAYSLVQTADSWSPSINDSQVTDYAATANGTGENLFSGGTYAYPTDGTGAVITSLGKVYRPNLVVQSGLPVAALGSLAVAGLVGAPVEAVPTTTFGYYSSALSSWGYAVGTGTSSQNPTVDQIGVARSSTGPTVGSLEGSTAASYLVSSPVVSGGSVSGASSYGDPYPAGALAVISAIPDAGYTFTQWSITSGPTSTTSTSNPLSLTVADNTVVTPMFAASGVGVRTVTYTATGATGGAPPPAASGSGVIAIASSGATLVRTGFALTSWNTSANGSGAAYALGSSYSGSPNLTLYPVWTAVVTYTVIYNSQGGSAVSAGSFPAGGAITTAPTPPSRTGFVFAGWARSVGGSAIAFPYSPGTAAPVTLYATWTTAQTVTATGAPRALGATGVSMGVPLATALVLLLCGATLATASRRFGNRKRPVTRV